MKIRELIQKIFPFMLQSTHSREMTLQRVRLQSMTRRADYYRDRFVEATDVISFPSLQFKASQDLNLEDVQPCRVLTIVAQPRVAYFSIPIKSFSVRGELERAVELMAEGGWLSMEEGLKTQYSQACQKAVKLAIEAQQGKR